MYTKFRHELYQARKAWVKSLLGPCHLSGTGTSELLKEFHWSQSGVSRGILLIQFWGGAQSRQSAKLFSSRRNWDSPSPSPAGECAPPPFSSGGRGTLTAAREGVGESQFQRGDIHCGTLYMYVICAPPPSYQAPSTSTLSGCTSFPRQR
jgi:hypothetical protein